MNNNQNQYPNMQNDPANNGNPNQYPNMQNNLANNGDLNQYPNMQNNSMNGLNNNYNTMNYNQPINDPNNIPIYNEQVSSINDMNTPNFDNNQQEGFYQNNYEEVPTKNKKRSIIMIVIIIIVFVVIVAGVLFFLKARGNDSNSSNSDKDIIKAKNAFVENINTAIIAVDEDIEILGANNKCYNIKQINDLSDLNEPIIENSWMGKVITNNSYIKVNKTINSAYVYDVCIVDEDGNGIDYTFSNSNIDTEDFVKIENTKSNIEQCQLPSQCTPVSDNNNNNDEDYNKTMEDNDNDA